MDRNCNNNTIRKNQIINNRDFGLVIANITKECQYNTLYENTFNNPLGINAVDNCSTNMWYLGTTGNWWHDYLGADTDDNLRGDIPYNITGTGTAQDLFPIWDDGCDVNCEPGEDDGPDEVEEFTPTDYSQFGLTITLSVIVIGGIFIAIGIYISRNPDKIRNFVKGLRGQGPKR